jgi:Xaa-Pro aminopeptidase
MKKGTAPERLDLVLEPGMCFTLEPRFFKMLDDSTYIQSALEETVMVTADGADVLTPAPFLDELIAARV